MKKDSDKIGEKAYLTKRAIIRASGKAFRQASERAMNIAGYVVKEKDGWIVQENENGTLESISRLGAEVKPEDIILD